MPAQPTSDATDVVIVGAGPTGLMAALLLRRCDVAVRIFDKAAAQAHESRAFAVHARSLELVRSIDLGDAFMERGVIASGAQVFVDGRRVSEIDFDDIGRADTPYPFVLMLPQSDIEAILADDLRRRGVTVEHGVEVTGFHQSGDGCVVEAVNATGVETPGGAGVRRTVAASYVIGADGAHSVVRKGLGLRFDGAPYPQGFFLADCRVDWPLDHDHLKIFVCDRNLAVFLPLRGREVSRIIAVQPYAEDAPGLEEVAGSAPATLAEVETALRAVAKVPVTLRDPRWVTRYRLHHRGVNRYGEGRVFVAGDAAHIHSPAGGQGMNTGLQDAANLAWKLALVLKHHAPAALLDSYHDERWPVGQKILQRTDRLFAGMSAQSTTAMRVRNFMLPIVAPAVSRITPLRAFAFGFVSQLGIRYHASRFVHDDTPHGPRAWRNGIRAGHRAPNARVTADRDVFDLIGGYRFHLLALSRRPLDDGEITRLAAELAVWAAAVGFDVATHLIARSLIGRDPRILQAESPEVFRTYGLSRRVPQALFLIRPDGYVAYRAADLDLTRARVFARERFTGL